MTLALEAPPVILTRARSIPDAIRDWTPRSRLGASVLKALRYLPDDLALEIVDRLRSAAVIESSLRIRVMRGAMFARVGLLDPREVVVEDHGVVGRKVVTTAGVNAIVDAFQNTVEVETFKYHGLGTGAVAEAVTDTTLGTELTTEYTGNVRATGTTVEGSAANIYETVATNTLDGTPAAALREHGIFSANAAGTLLDRTVFAAITLSSGDALQSTYDLTFSAGS